MLRRLLVLLLFVCLDCLFGWLDAGGCVCLIVWMCLRMVVGFVVVGYGSGFGRCCGFCMH